MNEPLMTLDDLRIQYIQALIALVNLATGPEIMNRIERLLFGSLVDLAPLLPLQPTAVATDSVIIDVVANEQREAMEKVVALIDPWPVNWRSPVDKLLEHEDEELAPSASEAITLRRRYSERPGAGAHSRQPDPCDICGEPQGRGAGMAAHVKHKHPGASIDWRGKWVAAGIHVHRWQCGAPVGTIVTGTCLECSEVKDFPADPYAGKTFGGKQVT